MFCQLYGVWGGGGLRNYLLYWYVSFTSLTIFVNGRVMCWVNFVIYIATNLIFKYLVIPSKRLKMETLERYEGRGVGFLMIHNGREKSLEQQHFFDLKYISYDFIDNTSFPLVNLPVFRNGFILKKLKLKSDDTVRKNYCNG